MRSVLLFLTVVALALSPALSPAQSRTADARPAARVDEPPRAKGRSGGNGVPVV